MKLLLRRNQRAGMLGKTVFTLEGLIYYLPPPAAAALLASARRLASPGSMLAFDFLHADVLEGRVRPPAFRVTAQVRAVGPL